MADDPTADPGDVDALAAEFEREGRPFARVTVVRREPPVSANVGDSALVTPDGEVSGWVGGAACAQSVAVKEATAAIEDGEPRLVGLAPDPDDVDRPGLAAYPMTCHSGGTLELFVEPVVRPPRLLVVGASPVARSLARVAREAGFAVTAVGPDEETTVDGAEETLSADDGEAVFAAAEDATAVVAASMGSFDGLGVEAGLRAGVDYVGLVASDTRRDDVAATVGDRLGLDPGDVVAAVTTPAGVDVGAETPGEIAVALAAELVAVRRGAAGAGEVADPSAVDVGDDETEGAGDADTQEEPGGTDDAGSADDTDRTHEAGSADDAGGTDDAGGSGAPAEEGGTAGTEDDKERTVVDPVCGMDVVVGEAGAVVEHGGERYHLCGQGCADAFAEDPGSYLDDADPGVVADD